MSGAVVAAEIQAVDASAVMLRLTDQLGSAAVRSLEEDDLTPGHGARQGVSQRDLRTNLAGGERLRTAPFHERDICGRCAQLRRKLTRLALVCHVRLPREDKHEGWFRTSPRGQRCERQGGEKDMDLHGGKRAGGS